MTKKKKKATSATDKLLKWPKLGEVNEPPDSRKTTPPHKTKIK